MLETHQYVRKQFNIDAVQITEKNMADVAAWTDGSIQTDDNNKKFVKVDVKRPLNLRQTQAFIGDWVLCAGEGFKCYTNKAFRSSFEQVSVETKLHDVSPKVKTQETVTVTTTLESAKPVTEEPPAAEVVENAPLTTVSN